MRCLLIVMLCALSPASWALSGSDADWSWRSHAEADGPPLSWAELSGYTDATDLELGTGDSATVELPFSFPFYGETYDEITVYAYGAVVPGSPSDDPGERGDGVCLSDEDYDGPLIAPLWTTYDLDAGGAVYVATYDDGVIIEWNNVYVESDDSSGHKVGVTLFSSGEIGFIYDKTSTGDSDTRTGLAGTSGVQSGDGDVVELGCESTYISSNDDSIYLTPWGARHLHGTFAVTDVADATVLGASGSDRLGYSVAALSDLDEDGTDELLIGAPLSDASASNAGVAYLFAGDSLSGDLSADEATATVLGDGRSDQLGFAVASAGDVDGDGLDEAIIGAPYADEGATNGGAAVLYAGSGLAGDFLFSDADAIYSGAVGNDYAGWAVCGAGDVDGDGYGDVLVGAPYSDDGDTNGGAAYLLLGSSAPGDQSLSGADASWYGDDASDFAGAAVAPLGDIDGDGYADFGIGAYGDDGGGASAGVVGIVRGGASVSGATALSDTEELTGDDGGDAAGIALAPLGDVSDDGDDDFIVGAYTAGSNNSGAAAYVEGSSSDLSGTLSGTAGLLLGESADRLARSVAAFDFGDAQGIAAGAYGNSGGASAAGAVYLAEIAALADAEAEAGSSRGLLLGSDATGYLGFSVATGDFDGDGYADVAAGAYGADGDASASGVVYLVVSRPTYPDEDGDGHIASSLGGLDCDDTDADVAPGVSEVCDGIDNDCDGVVDEGYGDGDSDGIADCVDAEECDGLDNDGDGSVDEGLPDADKDGTCDALDSEDCDGLDNDGDGFADEDFSDADGDGIADCVDAETCDGIDNNGDGSIDEGFDDTDGDGVADCVDGETCDGLDNDGDGAIDEDYPDTDRDGTADCIDTEACDGLDNDGDGGIDEGMDDTDGDGFCDDIDFEECDGLDNDGDGRADEDFDDNDGDGIADCIDGETCDGADNNGDGAVDEGYRDTDGDGTADCIDFEECDGLDNDGDGQIDEGFPDADFDSLPDCVDAETCDGVDNNGDGIIDEGFPDADGDGAADCIDVETCDGVDNDGDGQIDEGFPDRDGDGAATCVDETPDGAAAPAAQPGCSSTGDRAPTGWGALALLAVVLGLRRREGATKI